MTFAASFQDAWLPRRPLAGQRSGPDRQIKLKRGSRERALQLPYIETNPKALCSLVVIERDESDTDQVADLLGLPEPSWVAMNRHTGTGHVVFALASPVCLTDAGRRAPVNLLARIEQGMTDVLEGDVAYVGRITKNPHHSEHRALWGTQDALYSLRELAGALGNVGALPDRSRDARTLQDSSVGRNVALFHDVRKWAYPQRVKFTSADEWDQVVERRAQDRNDGVIGEHFTRGPMGSNEVHHLAQSISRWTWRNLSSHQDREQWTSPGRQQERGRRSGDKRTEAREQIMRELF